MLESLYEHANCESELNKVTLQTSLVVITIQINYFTEIHIYMIHLLIYGHLYVKGTSNCSILD